MAKKKKADWLAEAEKAGITGLSKENTVAQIRSAIEAGGLTEQAPSLSPEDEQAQNIAEREERRRARREEAAQASAARAEADAEAKALIRTAPQQAAQRAGEN